VIQYVCVKSSNNISPKEISLKERNTQMAIKHKTHFFMIQHTIGCIISKKEITLNCAQFQISATA